MQISTSDSYTSRQLKVHKRSYSMYEWMLSVVGFVLKLKRHYYLDRDLRCVVTTRIEYEENKVSGISKDYDFGLNYHPGKANVVTDALSRKSLHMSMSMIRELKMLEQFRDLSL